MNIGLFFGGKSCEHDISIITACGLGGAIPEAKKIYVDEKNRWWYVRKTLQPLQYKADKWFPRFIPVTMRPGSNKVYLKLGFLHIPLFSVDCAVLCFHGPNGEDGSIQGLMQLCNVAYTGSGVAASGIGMDKWLSKKLFESLGLPVVKGKVIDTNAYFDDGVDISDMEFPLIVKPCSLGSSIGITIAQNPMELENALSVAFAFDNRVIVENAIKDCHEANCCVLSGEPSEVFRPPMKGDILTFEDKYLSGGKYKPEVESNFAHEMKSAAKLIAAEMGLKGSARIDFIVTDDAWYVNEVNTIPGSLGYGHWKDKYTHREFVMKLIEEAKRIAEDKENLTFSYESVVLTGGNIKK